MLAGTVTIEALRGRNSLFRLDIDGEKMLGVPSCFAYESNNICDNWDSDIGASSKQKGREHACPRDCNTA
jgi:hypothetical protein